MNLKTLFINKLEDLLIDEQFSDVLELVLDGTENHNFDLNELPFLKNSILGYIEKLPLIKLYNFLTSKNEVPTSGDQIKLFNDEGYGFFLGRPNNDIYDYLLITKNELSCEAMWDLSIHDTAEFKKDYFIPEEILSTLAKEYCKYKGLHIRKEHIKKMLKF